VIRAKANLPTGVRSERANSNRQQLPVKVATENKNQKF